MPSNNSPTSQTPAQPQPSPETPDARAARLAAAHQVAPAELLAAAVLAFERSPLWTRDRAIAIATGRPLVKPEPLFEVLGGTPGPVARLPHYDDGSPRLADGVSTFTLAQAVERFGWSEASLRKLWASTFDEFYEPDAIAPGAAAKPPPAFTFGPDDYTYDEAAHTLRCRRCGKVLPGLLDPKVDTDTCHRLMTEHDARCQHPE